MVLLNTATAELNATAQHISALGEVLLNERVIDRVLGNDQLRNTDTCRVLDSSWLFYALHSWFIKLSLSKDIVEIRSLLSAKAPPNVLEEVPVWHTNSTKEMCQKTIAQPIPSKILQASLTNFCLLKTKRQFHRFLFSLRGLIGSRNVGSGFSFGGLYNSVDLPILELSISALLRMGAISADAIKLDWCAELSVANQDLRLKLMEQARAAIDSVSILDDRQAESLAWYVATSIPVSHFESRFTNWRSVEHLYRKYRPSGFISSVGWYYDTYLSHWAALVRHHGGKLVGIQHGGNYGYTANHSFPQQIEYQICDVFLSWGWEGEEVCDIASPRSRFVPSGGFHLRRLAQKKRSSQLAKSLLFCPASIDLIPPRIEFSPHNGTDFIAEKWPANVKALVEFCSKHSISLAVKAFPLSQHQDILIPLLKRECAVYGIPLEILPDDIHAYQLLASYEATAWDLLGSGFFESIAAGCPTFLLPSARGYPPLRPGIHVSRHFYVDQDSIQPLAEKFRKAASESEVFLKTFGKKSEVTLSQYLLANPQIWATHTSAHP